MDTVFWYSCRLFFMFLGWFAYMEGLVYPYTFMNSCLHCFCVQVLGRPGFSIADKKRKTGRIGFSHRIRKEEAMRWFQQKVSIAAASDANCVWDPKLPCIALGKYGRRVKFFDVVNKMRVQTVGLLLPTFALAPQLECFWEIQSAGKSNDRINHKNWCQRSSGDVLKSCNLIFI